MSTDENRPINVNEYNFDEAKLVASIKWIIHRVYENGEIPDRLQQMFAKDHQNVLRLSPTLSAILTDGSLYSQAASKILHDHTLINRTLGAVLRELSNADIEVRDADGQLVTEEMLISNPLHLVAHLSLIDALMSAHTKSIISIERVVQAVSIYTSVEQRECPLDSIDAILFWINKICLLVRDDVERQGIALKCGSDNDGELTIPELEDLYEDLCDGTCICALIAFYRPDAVDIREIFFTDPISLSDCRYNLQILKNFCENYLPWNPFHFEIDDILVLHESLQPNINAFLSDLFNFFEPLPALSPAASATSPTQRRFVQIQGIPDLRAQNLANRPLHPPKTNRNSYGSSQRDRTMSLASADSLMTTRSGDSLRYNNSKPTNIPVGAATTNFGNLNTEGVKNESSGQSSNQKSYTEMRLAFEEKKRDHERKLALNSALKEEERLTLGKNAFFKLMSNKNPPSSGSNSNEQSTIDQPQRYEGASTARELELSAQLEDIREELKNLKVMQEQQKSMSNLHQIGLSHATSQPSLYNDLYQQQQQPQFPQQMPPNQYGTLPHKSPHMFYGSPTDPMSARNAAYNMPPYVGNQPSQTFFPPQMAENSQHLYAMPNQTGMPPPYPTQPNPAYYPPQQNYPLQSSNSHGALHLAHQQSMQQQTYLPPIMQPTHQMFNQPNPMSYSMYEPHQMNGDLMSPPMMSNMHQMADPYGLQQQQAAGANSFRLHQPFATSSRLDPSLELNRNLTNWGFTHRADNGVGDVSKPQRKTWATVESERDTSQANYGQTNGHSTNGHQAEPSNATSFNHQQTPPKDPDLRSPQEREHSIHNNTQQTPTTTTFPVSNSSHDMSKSNSGALVLEDDSERTAEMETRRQALLMSQMKRKEKINSFKEDKKTELDERREEESRKQEMAEQRKLEREIKRQKLLEEYKRKKIEQELGDTSLGGSVSARASVSSTGSLNRGHSQPPYGRPKSQSNMSALQIQTLTMQRPNRTKSSVAPDENSAPRINVPALADPTLKLYAKHQPKSNRSLILNALQHSIFPGAVSNDQRNKVQTALAQSNSKHFLILFRDQRTQYRGLYTWDQNSDAVERIFDSGNKLFNSIPTKHLSATIDGFIVSDQFWSKPKIPHSRGV